VHHTSVEEAGVSHPSSAGSGSEAGGSDASAENGADADGARIQADGAEQPRASGRPGASQSIFEIINLDFMLDL
jgi:hypothetical protein